MTTVIRRSLYMTADHIAGRRVSQETRKTHVAGLNLALALFDGASVQRYNINDTLFQGGELDSTGVKRQ